MFSRKGRHYLGKMQQQNIGKTSSRSLKRSWRKCHETFWRQTFRNFSVKDNLRKYFEFARNYRRTSLKKKSHKTIPSKYSSNLVQASSELLINRISLCCNNYWITSHYMFTIYSPYVHYMFTIHSITSLQSLYIALAFNRSLTGWFYVCLSIQSTPTNYQKVNSGY